MVADDSGRSPIIERIVPLLGPFGSANNGTDHSRPIIVGTGPSEVAMTTSSLLLSVLSLSVYRVRSHLSTRWYYSCLCQRALGLGSSGSSRSRIPLYGGDMGILSPIICVLLTLWCLARMALLNSPSESQYPNMNSIGPPSQIERENFPCQPSTVE
jgi:hypothetical protein